MKHGGYANPSQGYTGLFCENSQSHDFFIAQLQMQLDNFRQVYNDQRPHKALHLKTPALSYTNPSDPIRDELLP